MHRIILSLLIVIGAVTLQAAGPVLSFQMSDLELKCVSFRYLTYKPLPVSPGNEGFAPQPSPLILAKTAALKSLHVSLKYDGEKGTVTFGESSFQLQGPVVIFVDERTMTAVILHDDWVDLEKKNGGDLSKTVRSLLSTYWDRLQLGQKPD